MSDLDNLPKGLQLTEEQLKVKSYALATISMDERGQYHAHYTGYNVVAGKPYFGSSIISSHNVRKLLDVLGSRLAKAEKIYQEKIQEILEAADKELKEESSNESEPTSPESDSVA